MIDLAISIVGLALGVFGLIVPTSYPKIVKKMARGGLVIGVLLLGTSGAIFFFPRGNAQVPNVNGNCNNIGNNNFNCNTVKFSPPRPIFTNQLGNELLKHMFLKKPVELISIGGASDQKVGDDFQEFLEKYGYTVQRDKEGIGTIFPLPDHPFTFRDSPEKYFVIVAPGIN